VTNNPYYEVVVLVIAHVRPGEYRDHALVLRAERCLSDAAGLIPLLVDGARLRLCGGGTAAWNYDLSADTP
jgi:hypothetical protein